MLAGLPDKRAIVTGAARGIGQAICRALAAEGVRVAVADLDEAAALAHPSFGFRGRPGGRVIE